MTINRLLQITFTGALVSLALLGTQPWAQTSPISPVYRSNDGGVLYVRDVGSDVYGFAEHPGKKYSVVFSGKRSGDKIAARFWGVPKGTFTEFGPIEFQISQNGARLVRKSGGVALGIDTWEEIATDAVPWTAPPVAGFQKTTTTDLDGVFEGNDASRHYLRELNGDVVWVAEAAAQPNERRSWVSVFIGRRTASGGVTGMYSDIPKGLANSHGTFGAALIGEKRELALEQTLVSRTRKLEPDYALDFDKFSAEINKALAGRFVGYGYAIARKGGIVRQGADGFRRLKQDGGELPFEARTSSQAASFSKTFTAVALAQALRMRNLDFNARIAPHIPKCWTLGVGMGAMTFGDLASHRSGLDDSDLQNKIANSDDPYNSVRGIIETGRTKAKPTSFDYQNANYGIMRYLVPAVATPDLFNQAFAQKDCNKDGAKINKTVSDLFANFQAKAVLKGNLAQFDVKATYEQQGNFALLYDVNDKKKKGWPANPEARLRAGAGYLSVSAIDAAIFLSNFDDGKIVPLPWVRMMKSERYGFDSWNIGKAGQYLWKNGGCPTVAGGIDCASWGMIYPGGVQAYVVVNSSGVPSGQNLGQILSSSYDKAIR